MSCCLNVQFEQPKQIVMLSLLCCTFSLLHTEKLLAGVSLLTVSSGSNGHVVPVAGWPLGATVAAQVLVDASHLISGHIIRHLQVWVVAVGRGAPHVHCLQQVLAIHHSDLHNDQFGLGIAEIVELLSKTQSDCGIRSRELTLLVQLKSLKKPSCVKNLDYSIPRKFTWHGAVLRAHFSQPAPEDTALAQPFDEYALLVGTDQYTSLQVAQELTRDMAQAVVLNDLSRGEMNTLHAV